MKNVKYIESSKYSDTRYKRESFIYFKDMQSKRYVLPIMFMLEKQDVLQDILVGISDKYWVFVGDSTEIQYGNMRFAIVELCGELENLISASEIIGR